MMIWIEIVKSIIVAKFKYSYTNEKHFPLLLGQTPYKENLKSHIILI